MLLKKHWLKTLTFDIKRVLSYDFCYPIYIFGSIAE